jgi:hypothetical protein
MYQKSPSRKFLDVSIKLLAVTILIAWGLLAYDIANGSRLFF